MPLTIVFVERKNRCNEVAAALQEEGIPAAALHGGLSQVGGLGSHAGDCTELRPSVPQVERGCFDRQHSCTTAQTAPC
jgi:hypothetical protein